MRLSDTRFPVMWQALMASLLMLMSSLPSYSQCNGCPELATRQLDLKGCIHLPYPGTQLVIRDKATMTSRVRNDMSRERCLAQLDDIDFDKYSLLGIELDTGWCEDPPFTYRAFKEEAKRRYLLSVIYQPPVSPCRALSQYDFWVLAPKLPEQYEVAFEVKEASPEK
jgi:hypothetical protein